MQNQGRRWRTESEKGQDKFLGHKSALKWLKKKKKGEKTTTQATLNPFDKALRLVAANSAMHVYVCSTYEM